VNDPDAQFIECLAPIAASRAKIYYPFFANTFPLAYHYHKTLLSSTVANHTASDTARRIIQLPWSTPVRTIIGQHNETNSDLPAVFYATLADAKTLQKTDYKHTVPFKHCVVWLYRPRYIFVELTPHTWDVSREHKTFSRAVLHDLMAGRNTIDVHTDIPSQALALLRQLDATDTYNVPLFPSATADTADVLTDAPPPGSTLRLYLYGGPLTAYLKRKTDRFIDFRVPDTLTDKQSDDFTTCICVAGHNGLLRGLKAYHTLLSNTAHTTDQDDLFWPLCNAYNRLARVTQHRSSFPTASAFAACLREHIAKEPEKQQQIAAEQPVLNGPGLSTQPPFVLYGCGKLAIGLILAALNPDVPVLVVYVRHRKCAESAVQNVIKEDAINWDDVVLRGELTLSNSEGYGQAFKVISPEDAADDRKWLNQKGRRFLTVADDWERAVELGFGNKWVGTALRNGLNDFLTCLSTRLRAKRSIERSDPKPPLLFFENRVDLHKARQLVSSVFEPTQVLCDRICSTMRPTLGKVAVEAEPYGELVVDEKYISLFRNNVRVMPFSRSYADFGPGPEADDNGFGSETRVNRQIPPILVRTYQTQESHEPVHPINEFYRRRKRWLMNGVQHVLALLAIESILQRGLRVYRGIPVFLAESLIGKTNLALSSCLDVFVQCQICRLMTAPANLSKRDDQPLVESFLQRPIDAPALYGNLLAYADMNRRRCGDVTDEIHRLIDANEFKRFADTFNELVMEMFEDMIQNTSWHQRAQDMKIPIIPSDHDIKRACRLFAGASSNFYRFAVELKSIY
jgi:hypothetical protein